MVLFTLYVRADLEHVDSMVLSPGANICISVRNPLSDFEVRERVVIETGAELMNPGVLHANGATHEIENREPPSHFALKWDGAQNRSTVQVLDQAAVEAASTKAGKRGRKGHHKDTDVSVLPRALTGEDSGSFVPMLALECQGLEPYAFHPLGGEFVVTNKAGVKFDGVDLSEGAWSHVELSSGSTTISNFEAKFE